MTYINLGVLAQEQQPSIWETIATEVPSVISATSEAMLRVRQLDQQIEALKRQRKAEKLQAEQMLASLRAAGISVPSTVPTTTGMELPTWAPLAAVGALAILLILAMK